MTKNSKHLVYLLLIIIPFWISCSTSKKTFKKRETGTINALHEVLEKNGYKPVQIPRDFDGVKSIIRLGDGEELVISPPNYCLGGLKTGGGTAQFPLTEKESMHHFSAKAGTEYLKIKKISVDVDAAFNKYKVKDVIVHINSAKIDKIYPIQLEEYLEKNTLSKSCSKRFHPDSVYVIIYETVIANDLTYSFIKEDSTKLKISADFLSLLGINTDYSSTNKEKTTLSIKEPLIIGYKVMKINQFIGSFTGSVRIGTLKELSVNEIEELISH